MSQIADARRLAPPDSQPPTNVVYALASVTDVTQNLGAGDSSAHPSGMQHLEFTPSPIGVSGSRARRRSPRSERPVDRRAAPTLDNPATL